ncbi:hypothetical protein BRI6_0968 [plant metagenome]|uniref:Uncharacterized protein n=1 Tax=plant metagenome TaxID=1297885 RepID=A0A484RPE7_9ZZZZ
MSQVTGCPAQATMHAQGRLGNRGATCIEEGPDSTGQDNG